MALAMNATVTTMSSKPCGRSRLTTCSIIGMLAMGSMGFGWFDVSGRSLVPSPPAMMTAFIATVSSFVGRRRRPPSPRLGRPGDVRGQRPAGRPGGRRRRRPRPGRARAVR